MKLSARSRYAARILLELARQSGDAPISATVLSQQTGVSVQFVEQILKPLKQKGFTSSQRGAAGGHRLAKPASSITFGQIVRLMEGGIYLTVCCGEEAAKCPRQDGCLTRQAWISVSRALERELDSITLADLLQDGEVCPENKISLTKKSKAASKRTVRKTDGTQAPAPKRQVRSVITRRAKRVS